MTGERFMKLVQDCQGFEFYQAYRDDIDHIMGGKGDTYWYVIMKRGKVTDSYIGTYRDGVWTDRHIKGAGAKRTSKPMPEGSTIARIQEHAYLLQDAKWVAGRKTRLIEDAHPHYHYVYGFGDKGLDVSEKYGVTIAFSDVNDVDVGFHLRYLYTGDDVELPE